MRNSKEFDKPLYLGAAQAYLMGIEDLQNPVKGTKMSGRFDQFNKVTGGFRGKEFTILCGATGVGKTTLLANWSADLVEQKIPHFVASVETGHTDYVRRIICAMTGLNINNGDEISPEKVKELYERTHDRFLNCGFNISLYENRFPVEQLINDLWFMKEEHGCRVAFIDNLNFFMEVTSASNQIIEMDRVIHELIIFCKQCDIHVVMVMHPKKTDHGRVESEFDIKGSSTAVQEAHNVFLFNRVSEEAIKQGMAIQGDREFKIQKMRRRGEYVGSSIIMTGNSVRYSEGKMYAVGK